MKKIFLILPFLCIACNKKDFLKWPQIDFNPPVIKVNSTLEHSDKASEDTEGFRKLYGSSYIAKDDIVIPYRIYRPDDHKNRKLPLLVILHGAGEHGNDNIKQLRWCALSPFEKGREEFLNSVIIVPQSPDGNWTWIGPHTPKKCYEDNIQETNMLSAVFELAKLYAGLPYIDENRIYLLGVSAGGYAVYELIAKHPNFFAAGVPMSSGGPLCKEAIAVLKNVPIYAFHGDKDTTIPYATGTPVVYNKIKESGGRKMIFKTYSGSGHNIWDKAINFSGDDEYPNTLTWLFAQKR